MLADYVRGTLGTARYLVNGGGATLKDYGADRDRLHRDAAFLERLPPYHETEEYIFVHAGLEPGIPLEQQEVERMLWIRGSFIRGYRGKTVVFGHTPTLGINGTTEVYRGEDKIGIDTGVAYGGLLTMLELPSGRTYQSPGDDVG